jgi:hypothetical protein
VSMAKLRVITKSQQADTPKQRVRDRVKAMDKPEQIAQCPRCGCREVIETKIGVTIRNGKSVGGTKQLICAACYMLGSRVVIR